MVEDEEKAEAEGERCKSFCLNIYFFEINVDKDVVEKRSVG